MTDTDPKTRAHAIPSRWCGMRMIWALIATMAVSALALHATPQLGRPALAGPFHLWWPVLALGFAGSEVWVIHIHFRRDAHSFSLSEVPLVLGLFFVSPLGLVLAQVLGAAVALIVHRRQSPQKVFFNLAQFWLGTCLSILVFRSVVDGGNRALGPLDWGAAFAATSLTTVLGILVILVAIALSEGRIDVRRFPPAIRQALVVTATNTCLGLAAVTLVWSSRWALWLIAIPAAAVYLSYRAYMQERQKHESLEFLYEESRTLQQGDDVRAAVEDLLGKVATMFRAEHSEIILFPSAEHDTATAIRFAASDQTVSTATISAADAEQIAAHAARRSPVLISAAERDLAPAWVNRLCTKDGMLSALTGETRTVGVLLVANRFGQASTFDDADLRLFETLAHQASVAIENDRLEAAVNRLAQLQDQLTHQAYHDPLTRLANRPLLVEAATERLARGDAVTLLFVDLDDFKTINDSLGHEAGDQLLVEVAARIDSCLAEGELAARLGGDEFAVLLIGDNRSRGSAVASAILESLEGAIAVADTELLVHASIGITHSDPEQEARDLLRDADVAMYHAKSNGKCRIEEFHPDMRDAVRRRHELKADLQRAVDRNEFVVHYQPIVELETGLIVGAEALVRWDHPDRGRVAPDEFITLAEETGHIVDIGRFVLREACRQTVAWHEAFGVGAPLRINVNLSARQLREPTLVADVQAALADSGLDAGFLSLEITESAFVHDSDRAVGTMHALCGLGVQLAMDDFGTGYSSLGYLRTLPLAAIKVPKPFVDRIDAAPADYAIAQAIVTLGTTMELSVVAEGIERPEQLDALIRMNCRLGQGYHFARPLDPAGISKLLHSQMERKWPVGGTSRRVVEEGRPRLALVACDQPAITTTAM